MTTDKFLARPIPPPSASDPGLLVPSKVWTLAPAGPAGGGLFFFFSRPALRASFPIHLSNSQRCAARLEGAGAPCRFPLPKIEGSRAPTGAGAEAPHPVTRLAVGSISGSPEITGP